MEFDQVATTVRGLRKMTPEQRRRIYDQVRRTQPREVLELGTSYGVSAAHMAPALDANALAGEGEQALGRAARTACAGKASIKDAAVEVARAHPVENAAPEAVAALKNDLSGASLMLRRGSSRSA